MYCGICKRKLPESAFYINRVRGGYYTGCKECRKQYNKNRTNYTKQEYKYYEMTSNPEGKQYIKEACRLFDITPVDFNSNCKVRKYSLARKYVTQKLRDNTKMSTTQIGQIVHTDHATVIYSCREYSRNMVKKYLLEHNIIKPEIKHFNYKTGKVE